MLKDNTFATAQRSSRIYENLRIQQFYDAEHHASRAVAQSLGRAGEIAWDIYLFYPAGGSWKNAPPLPKVWMHQLNATYSLPFWYTLSSRDLGLAVNPSR